MSVVPNTHLKSADSLELQTFGVELKIDSAVQRIDMFTRYLGYWKSCVIRNTQLLDSVTYRTEPNAPLRTVKPNSELPIKGWGSFLEVNSAAAAPEGVVEFEVVTEKEAIRNA